MQDAAVREQVNGIFRDVFDDASITVFDAMTAKDVDGWDSLTHINLIVAAEKTFKVKFTTKDIQSLSNVGEFIALIRRKLAG